VAQRSSPQPTDAELEFGISHFLSQLIKTLEAEQTKNPIQSLKLSGPSGGENSAFSEMGETATQHGRELLRSGFSIEQVVHDYGDMCQAITELALEQDERIETDEFRTLNRCLDNAIATAVTEFCNQHDSVATDRQNAAFNQRLGMFAHELRNHLNSATLALSAVRSGDVGIGGATAAILDRSLVGMRNLIERSLSEVRLDAGLPVMDRVFSLRELIATVKLTAQLEAQVKGCQFSVSAVDADLFVEGDRDLLLSAIGNLLQNAFKFTHHGSDVALKAYSVEDRILIDVEDHCGGLAPGSAEAMFLPFKQMSRDRSGVGLGLSISQRSVIANRGSLSVRNVPGSGCVFTINIPRQPPPQHSSGFGPSQMQHKSA